MARQHRVCPAAAAALAVAYLVLAPSSSTSAAAAATVAPPPPPPTPGGVSVVDLRVEHLPASWASENAVDERLPRFSWSLAGTVRAEAQRSYRLVVSTATSAATTTSAPLPGGTVVWDSGVVVK